MTQLSVAGGTWPIRPARAQCGQRVLAAEAAGLLPPPGPHALRELHVASWLLPAAAAAALLRDLCLLPLGRRPGRRDQRRRPRACALLDGGRPSSSAATPATRRASGVRGPGRHDREFAIPPRAVRRSADAFRQDQHVRRYATPDDVLDYCRNSANPVGRLVLYLGRCHDEPRGPAVRLDLHRLATGQLLPGRGPRLGTGSRLSAARDARPAGYDRGDVRPRASSTRRFARRCAEEVDRAEALPARGRAAGRPDAARRCGWTWRCSSPAGWRSASHSPGWTTTSGARPTLSQVQPSCGCWPAAGGSTPCGRPERQGVPRWMNEHALAASYAHCQQIARRIGVELLLFVPAAAQAQAAARCARCMPFCDAPTIWATATSRSSARRAALARWRSSLLGHLPGQYDDPLLPALADTVRELSRFPPEYLRRHRRRGNGPRRRASYETFDRAGSVLPPRGLGRGPGLPAHLGLHERPRRSSPPAAAAWPFN